MIADEQLDAVEGYKEYIHHELVPEPEEVSEEWTTNAMPAKSVNGAMNPNPKRIGLVSISNRITIMWTFWTIVDQKRKNNNCLDTMYNKAVFTGQLSQHLVNT